MRTRESGRRNSAAHIQPHPHRIRFFGGRFVGDARRVLCPEVRGVLLSECISSRGIAIGGRLLVRLSEVVRFSECPLSEVLLYTF